MTKKQRIAELRAELALLTRPLWEHDGAEYCIHGLSDDDRIVTLAGPQFEANDALATLLALAPETLRLLRAAAQTPEIAAHLENFA